MEPSRTLSHYLLIEKIGEGGMGDGWRAVDTRLEPFCHVENADIGAACRTGRTRACVPGRRLPRRCTSATSWR